MIYLHPDVHCDERLRRRSLDLVGGAAEGRIVLCVETEPGDETGASLNGVDVPAGIGAVGVDARWGPETLACSLHQMADLPVATARDAGRHGKACLVNLVRLAAACGVPYRGGRADVIGGIVSGLPPGFAGLRTRDANDAVIRAAQAAGGLPGSVALADVRAYCEEVAGEDMRSAIPRRVTVERERAMADNLLLAESRNPGRDVHAVLGAGHLVPGLGEDRARRLGLWTPEFAAYHSAIPRGSRLTEILARSGRPFRIVDDHVA